MVMSYNTEYKDYNSRMGGYAAKIRNVAPAVVGLQECQNRDGLAGLSHFAANRETELHAVRFQQGHPPRRGVDAHPKGQLCRPCHHVGEVQVWHHRVLLFQYPPSTQPWRGRLQAYACAHRDDAPAEASGVGRRGQAHDCGWRHELVCFRLRSRRRWWFREQFGGEWFRGCLHSTGQRGRLQWLGPHLVFCCALDSQQLQRCRHWWK